MRKNSAQYVANFFSTILRSSRKLVRKNLSWKKYVSLTNWQILTEKTLRRGKIRIRERDRRVVVQGRVARQERLGQRYRQVLLRAER